VLNDYHDIEEDKAHPVKKNRPLASGRVTKSSAKVLIFGLMSFSLFGSFVLSIEFMAVVMFYIVLNIAYTFKLKHISILDISIIAVGFVLRIYAGAVLIDNSPSMWIVLVTFVLALFLALAKRRDDCLLALDGYNLEMVNSAMSLMAGVTILSYIMYTVSPEVIEKLGTHNLYLTSFFVIIGILRYMQLTFVLQNSGSPTKLVLKDRFLQLTIIAWIVSFYIIRGF